MKLNKREKQIREILIGVAQGQYKTKYVGLISYKELWLRISNKPWHQGRTSSIVNTISRISTCELLANRPPLNELVVSKKTGIPAEPWESIKAHHLDNFPGVTVPYQSHEEAQEACWFYWNTSSNQNFNEKDMVEEGLLQDRRRKFRERNKAIVKRRKELDDYACQSCGFRLEINGIFIIDCHHIHPLGMRSDVRVTDIKHLICLCPTCHRIAHTSQYPLDAKEVQAIRTLHSV